MTSVLDSYREGPCFSNQGLRLGPVVEKAKGSHTLSCIIQNQLAMTRGILSHKGQPCPTNNDVMDHVTNTATWLDCTVGHGLYTQFTRPFPLLWK